MTDTTLRRLGDLVGILPGYYDIWGHRFETSESTRRALLAAMGIAVGDEVGAAASLETWQQKIWRSLLPPVKVAYIDETASVTLRMPETSLPAARHWRLSLENGGVLEGTFRPEALPVLETETLNGIPLVAVALELPAMAETGYHRLEIQTVSGEALSMPFIVCPRQTYVPPSLRASERLWGLSVQLYGVRSERNWGMGDYADLAQILAWAGKAGAGFIGLNPLHALFPHNPQHCSPYSPSSRRYFNVLYLNVEAIPEFAECAEALALVTSATFAERLRALKATAKVDYAGVASAKYAVLEHIYRHFRAHHLAADSARAQAFRAFQAQGGDDLADFACHQTLQEHFAKQDATLWGWPVWPPAYQCPSTAEVQAFKKHRQERLEWFIWLQWLAQEQIDAARRQAEDSGMPIGLYLDLAVGVDKAAAETWAHGDLYALEASVGCPPDDFAPLGQDWGLPPWIPHRLTESAYAPFIAMLRANMKYAGALRIDHVMGMLRLFWVPPGQHGDAGAYVAYPFRDLLGLIALESQRNRCLIVGEDLGTVPDEVRNALREMGVLSCRLFYFERQQDGEFMPPSWYPEQSLAAASTHDLPTLQGFWQGTDIQTRAELRLFPDTETLAAQTAARSADRWRLLAALAREGLLPEGVLPNPDDLTELTPAVLCAIHRYLARTPAKLCLVQAEDIWGESAQANLPGTTDEHPNWRRKFGPVLEDWRGDERVIALLAAMRAERPAIG